MRYINIPDTNLNSSIICMGGGPLGISLNKKESFKLLDTFINFGGNFIDTANIYGKWLPEGENVSELVLGQWIKNRKNRENVIIGTKGAHPNLDTMHIPRLSHDEIVNDLNESLSSLKTDYIDIYWLHRDDEDSPVAEILEIMNEQVKIGKIRFFGCSNWKVERIREAMKYAAKHNIKSFVGNQMMWSYAVPNGKKFEDSTMVQMDKKGIKFHVDTQLTAIPYSSQAQGFFTKLEKNKGNINKLAGKRKQRYYNSENIKRYKRALKLSSELSKSISEIVLSYLISKPFPVIPIAGFSNRDQLRESIKAGDLVLEEGMVNFLEDGKI